LRYRGIFIIFLIYSEKLQLKAKSRKIRT